MKNASVTEIMSDKSVDFQFDVVFIIPLVVMAFIRIECKG